jgi:hypothetical protein
MEHAMEHSDSKAHTSIYVRLLEEGVDVWRPVAATRVGESMYRIAGDTPTGESWEYKTAELVWCRPRVFADGTHGLETYAPVVAA